MHSEKLGPRLTQSSYRNFLMACTPLVEQKVQPDYAALLNEPIPPGVRNLQLWIEDAWACGTCASFQDKSF